MRYAINFDKLVNRFVPHYIGGRKLILYLQAILKPMQKLNDDFVNYAKETRIEASMTSQIFMFEWFLNRRFSKYFSNGGQITIRNSERLGVPIYYSNANIDQESNIVVRYASEGGTNSVNLRFQDENTETSATSFVVTSPAIDTSQITKDQYEAMLTYCIEKYRISNKTYIIKYTSNE